MRSTIWKKTLICLGAVLFLESPAVSTAFAYTVKAENTDALKRPPAISRVFC
ncbi:MAG: hypothetical protein ACLURP_03735 [Ruminococcus sp.]